MRDNSWFAPFVHSLSLERLREIMLELASTEESVRRRLLRERSQEVGDNPIQLAAHFQISLDKLLKIPSRAVFNAWDDASNWLDRVEAELLPVAPRAALDLLEQLIAAEDVLFSDTDCDWEGGVLLENVCSLWLCAAALCGDDQQKLVVRTCNLYCADDYNARDALLSQAHLLFDEAGLRALAECLRHNLSKEPRQMQYALKLLANAFHEQKNIASGNGKKTSKDT